MHSLVKDDAMERILLPLVIVLFLFGCTPEGYLRVYVRDYESQLGVSGVVIDAKIPQAWRLLPRMGDVGSTDDNGCAELYTDVEDRMLLFIYVPGEEKMLLNLSGHPQKVGPSDWLTPVYADRFGEIAGPIEVKVVEGAEGGGGCKTGDHPVRK